MATQNPIEQEGTYPLPEAQLDRFFFKLIVNYSGREEMATILDRTTRNEWPQAEQVMDGDEIRSWQELVREVLVAPPVQDYAIRLVLATHPQGEFATADTNRLPAVRRQPARRPGRRAGRQGAGAAARPVQRQLRGRALRLPAGDAAPGAAELRSPGGEHPVRSGAGGDPERGQGKGGHGSADRPVRARSIAERIGRSVRYAIARVLRSMRHRDTIRIMPDTVTPLLDPNSWPGSNSSSWSRARSSSAG